jgi:sterol desaturase/sphingolipid hydroxylase (fatty acid hydroxylase superfamily)
MSYLTDAVNWTLATASMIGTTFFAYPSDRLWFGWLGVYVAIGVAYHLITTKSWSVLAGLKYLFPKNVYMSRIFANDVLCFVVQLTLYKQVLDLALFMDYDVTGISKIIRASPLFSWAPVATESTVAANLTYSVFAFLCVEFGWYISHYMSHRVPVLWAFHRIHHDAEALTPLNNNRTHFIEYFVGSCITGLFLAFITVGFMAFGYAPAKEYILGVPVILFLTGDFFFGNFRHSHIPIDFGKLNYVLSSPLMHHIHHSNKPEHIDKNFSLNLTFFDWLFSTLYIPKKGETLELGTGRPEPTFIKLYFVAPMTDSWAYLKNGEWFRHKANRPVPQNLEAKPNNTAKKAA